MWALYIRLNRFRSCDTSPFVSLSIGQHTSTYGFKTRLVIAGNMGLICLYPLSYYPIYAISAA